MKSFYILWPFVYFVEMCFIPWQFGRLCGHLLYFPIFLPIYYPEKSGNPDPDGTIHVDTDLYHLNTDLIFF
jgi:hypothetical protein